MTSRLLAPLFLLFLCWPTTADAAPVRIALDSAARCPDAARFDAMVKSAEPSVEITSDEGAPLADVRLEARGERFHGELRWQDGDPRTADAADCTTLARAIALMVGMKSTQPPPPPPVVVEAEPPPVVVKPVVAAPPAAEEAESEEQPHVTDHEVQLGAIMRDQIVSGEFSPGIAIGYSFRTTRGWAFSFSQMTMYSWGDDGWMSGSLLATASTICPVGFRSGRFSLYTCTRIELGTKEETYKLPGRWDEQKHFWAAVGPSIQGRFDVSEHVFVNLDLASVYTFSKLGGGPNLVSTDAANGVSYVSPRSSRWSLPMTASIGLSW